MNAIANTEHDLGQTGPGVLRLTVAADIVWVFGLEVGGLCVEEEQVDFYVQQIGDSDEHRFLHLRLRVCCDEEVHRLIRLIVINRLQT